MKRRYSYSDQKGQRHRWRWILLMVLVFFLIYTFLTSLVFSVRVIKNSTMEPNLRYGEHLIFSSYNIYSIVPGLNLGNGVLPFQRGNIVLIDMLNGERPPLFYHLFDGVLRFFTAQKLSLIEQKEHLYIKRVIGLPGDEITMTNYVIRVKAKGSTYSLTEFEVSSQDYTPEIPQAPALWDSSLPFSGSMDPIVLGENECYVLSDDRSNTNDSRTWGPVPVNNISGKALFRYWPLTKIGRL
ncbi:MAG: signal peptidase I [Treponema sp.]|nr:signal peptidase I [Treponema sp.]